MDTTASETMVRFLAARFKVPIPGLKVTRLKGAIGSYYAMLIQIRMRVGDQTVKLRKEKRGMICISRRDEAWHIAHEFAHHVEQSRHTRMIREPHAESFYWILRKVIAAIGIVDYPWAQEYHQIRGWARRDGILQDAPEGVS